MHSDAFTRVSKPAARRDDKFRGNRGEDDIDCVTDDDDFLEFVSPLRKKTKKTEVSEKKVKQESKDHSKDLRTKNHKLSQTTKSANQGRASFHNFATKLKDKMKINKLELANERDKNLCANKEPDQNIVITSAKNNESQQFTLLSKPMATLNSGVDNLTSSSHITTMISDNDDFYGLPSKVKSLFWVHRSISKLYDWQDKCLQLECKSPGSNLIYSLPTSGGKTLVAEILMMKQVIRTQKNVIFILPFVAIVQEKIKSLAPFGVDLNFLVEEYAGSKGKLPPVKHRRKSIYVATIEKAASLINSLIENNRLTEIGLVVVDELHMVGEGGSRGSTLESTIAKIMFSSSSTQLIGMSATLSNIEDLKKFLNAQLYVDDFRPVELKEHVKISDGVYSVDNRIEDKLEFLKFVSFKDLYTKESQKLDPDHLFGLVMEVTPKESCLIFCSTKKTCENVAQLLCTLMPSSMKNVKTKERMELLKNLKADEGLACPILEKTIMFGVAYHHSGLTGEERKLIEEAYLEGAICIITCTSTLAAGVNLPAKRVILRSPYVGCDFMSRTQYKQMVGRAGRAGFHSSGESYLIINNEDKTKVLTLLGGGSEECTSSLLHEGSRGLSSMILSSIGLKMVTNTHEMALFLKRTLCYIQSGSNKDVDLTKEANNCLKDLIDDGYVSQKVSTESGSKAQLDVTKLGRAIFKGSIDPKLGKKLHTDLKHNLSSLVLSSHLHLLYAITPYDIHTDIQWMIYLNETFSLSKEETKLLTILGISEAYLHRKASGMSSRNVTADKEDAARRFYLTLMLNVLLKKESMWEVATKFQVTRGFVQNLLSSAATFASCVLHFCQELEDLWAYQNLLPSFIKKLSYCCSMELIPLLEIPGVKIGRARLMYKAGFVTAQQIAQSNVDTLTGNVELMPRKVARQIIASAQMLVKEKLEDLLHDVQELVPIPTIGSQLDISNSSFFNDALDFINISQL